MKKIVPKILAIDDKEDNLLILSALLKNMIPECEVIVAQSGTEGIEKALSEAPDTILVDVKMPEMDGYEVCERLKKNERTSSIPIIILTAVTTDPESHVRGLESGAVAFLTKPIHEAELAAQVKVALRIKQAKDELQRSADF